MKQMIEACKAKWAARHPALQCRFASRRRRRAATGDHEEAFDAPAVIGRDVRREDVLTDHAANRSAGVILGDFVARRVGEISPT